MNRDNELDRYDQEVVQEIARHMVHPSPLQSILEMIGKPIDLALAALGNADGKLTRRISRSVDEGIKRAINRSVILGGKMMRDRVVMTRFQKAGYRLSRYEEVSGLPLEAMDQIADTFNTPNSALVTTEGALMGAAASLAEALPGAQIVIPALVTTDVGASMTLLSRHLVQLGSAYGFSVRHDRSNIAHVLGAMVPQKFSYDEGFIPIKVYVMNAAKEAGEFALRVGLRSGQVGFGNAMKQLGKEAPQLIKLINMVIERLGVRVSQKVFGMLVPMVGGAINGGINLAFQRTGHRTGKDYFRLMILTGKYGDERLKKALDKEIARQRGSAQPAAAPPQLEG